MKIDNADGFDRIVKSWKNGQFTSDNLPTNIRIVAFDRKIYFI